jgi:hypothetical protein
MRRAKQLLLLLGLLSALSATASTQFAAYYDGKREQAYVRIITDADSWRGPVELVVNGRVIWESTAEVPAQSVWTLTSPTELGGGNSLWDETVVVRVGRNAKGPGESIYGSAAWRLFIYDDRNSDQEARLRRFAASPQDETHLTWPMALSRFPAGGIDAVTGGSAVIGAQALAAMDAEQFAVLDTWVTRGLGLAIIEDRATPAPDPRIATLAGLTDIGGRRPVSTAYLEWLTATAPDAAVSAMQVSSIVAGPAAAQTPRLLVRHRRGWGNVAYCALDVCAPTFLDWPGSVPFLEALEGATHRRWPYMQIQRKDVRSEFSATDEALSLGERYGSIVPVALLGAALFCACVAAAQRRYNRGAWTQAQLLRLLWVAAALALVGIGLTRLLLRHNALQVRMVESEVWLPAVGQAHIAQIVDIRSSLPDQRQIDWPGATPQWVGGGAGRFEMWEATGDYWLGPFRAGPPLAVSFDALQSRRLYAYWQKPRTDSGAITADLRLRADGRVVGRIRNTSTESFAAGELWVPGESATRPFRGEFGTQASWVSLPALAPGAEIDVDGMRRQQPTLEPQPSLPARLLAPGRTAAFIGLSTRCRQLPSGLGDTEPEQARLVFQAVPIAREPPAERRFLPVKFERRASLSYGGSGTWKTLEMTLAGTIVELELQREDAAPVSAATLVVSGRWIRHTEDRGASGRVAAELFDFQRGQWAAIGSWQTTPLDAAGRARMREQLQAWRRGEAAASADAEAKGQNQAFRIVIAEPQRFVAIATALLTPTGTMALRLRHDGELAFSLTTVAVHPEAEAADD